LDAKIKILITGADGFIGKNLAEHLNANESYEVLSFDKGCDESLLDRYCAECSFVFHLAGINRPQNPSEFKEGNFEFTMTLLEKLATAHNSPPVLMSSSVQAELDNDYGKSKRAGEDALREYATNSGAQTFIFRLPNVFGKWCRPHYNSAVATFCYQIARGAPIQINNRETELMLVYIDDVVDVFINAMSGTVLIENGFAKVSPEYKIKLGKIADLLYDFSDSRVSLMCPPQVPGSFEKKLYSTYLSYLPVDGFKYALKMNADERGSFTEFLRTDGYGQISVNVAKPGITKGNHWHHSKNEKFLVVNGTGVIRFKKVDEPDIIEYYVSGQKFEVVDIPCGYTHSIENLGESDLVTVMWASEPFDPQKPDTVFLKVL